MMKRKPCSKGYRVDECLHRIQQLRARFGLTKARLARRMGVSPSAVSRWESGRSRPRPERWEQIVRAETLGVHALAEGFGPRRWPVSPAKIAAMPEAWAYVAAHGAEVVGVSTA